MFSFKLHIVPTNIHGGHLILKMKISNWKREKHHTFRPLHHENVHSQNTREKAFRHPAPRIIMYLNEFIPYLNPPANRIQFGFLPFCFAFWKQLINAKISSILKESLLTKPLAPHLIAASLYSGESYSNWAIIFAKIPSNSPLPKGRTHHHPPLKKGDWGGF